MPLPSEREDLRRISKELNDAISGATIAVAVDLTLDLERRTPKRTGRTSEHWIAGKGRAGPGGVYSRSVASVAQDAGLVSIQNFNAETDKVITIENRLDHIVELNDRRHGFVQRAIDFVLGIRRAGRRSGRRRR